MANVAPAVVTITGSTGPGESITSLRFTDVVNISADFSKNTLAVTRSGVAGAPKITYYDYSAITTVTWTIASGITTIVFS